ncbi:MAG TPA: RIP metalloprotease RseP [Bryobacteraceae bacterium]|nr:RIP metalloprotease RseP [Bryobacteraceae bacterium]
MIPVIQSVWWLIVLIGGMILLHELGHFWAARFFDVRVDVFSFGFGPRLFGFRRGETDFRFSAILFGGYVKMAGDTPGDENINDPRAFLAKPRWQRLIVVAAGPFMNLVLAVAVLTGVFMWHYPKPLDKTAVIGYVAPNSIAAKAGLQPGDEIVQIDGENNPSWMDVQMREASSPNHPITVWIRRGTERNKVEVTPEADKKTGLGLPIGWDMETDQVGSIVAGLPAQRAGLKRGDLLLRVNGQQVWSIRRLQELIAASNGQPLAVTYMRDGKEYNASITPQRGKLDGGPERWVIGVGLEPRFVMTQLSLPDALAASVKQNRKFATWVFDTIGDIIQRRLSPKSLSGPIGIAQASREAAQEGPEAFLGLMAMISVNLAIFNLLPIPILDGGTIVLLLLEMVMRRDLSLQVKETVFKLGFVFLMAVVVFAIYNDIAKIIPG